VTAHHGTNRDASDVLAITLRDLQWRARRFAIAGLGAATVFAMTLVVAGLLSSFHHETRRTLDAIGADGWVVREGVDGVFTTPSVVPVSLAHEVARAPGVRRADPIVVLHNTVQWHGTKDVNVIGHTPGGLGTPPVSEGRLAQAAGEIVVDRSLGIGLGQTVQLAGRAMRVVGRTAGLSINGGQPVVFLPLAEAQKALVNGLPVASAVVTQGMPRDLPDGYVVRDDRATRSDLLRPLDGALTSLRLTLWLLWGVAALVVGSAVYLTALERRRDFAVYKATGWSLWDLVASQVVQAVVLSVAASVVALLLALVLVPLFPLTFSVPARSAAALPAVAVGVGLLASAAGLRRAVGVEPALAFGGP
jgi:putative ABC transport system permease protein